MRPTVFATFVVTLVFVDVALHTGLGLGAVAPDLIAVAVLLVARRATATRAVVLAVCLGLLDDAMGIGNLGARSLGLGAAALLGTSSLRIFEGEGAVFMALYLFIGKWAADAIVSLVLSAASARQAALALVTSVPLEAAWASLAGLLALFTFRVVAGRAA